MLDGYCKVDLSGRIIYSNSAFRTLLGYSPEELLTCTVKNLTPDRWHSLDDEMLQRHLDQDGATPSYFKELLDKTGVSIPVSIRWFLERDDLGHPIGTSFSVRDTRPSNEEKQRLAILRSEFQYQLQEQTQELALTNKELESFVHTVSHDLRVPLHGLLGWSQALLEDCGKELSETGHHHIEQIRAQVAQLTGLLDGLLALAQLARNDIHRESIDLTILVKEVWNTLQASAPYRKIELLMEGKLIVNADPILMRVIVQNLVENAWKFTSARSPARVEIGRRQDPETTVFYIRDNGVGFANNRSHKLFLPFQRLHRQSDFPGTGLGLATVRKAIQRQGGRVWATSEEGNGATFFFTL
jgi:PAS domain S-box-containing protein